MISKKFVERAEAAGHVDEAEAVFGKTDFARKEIVEVQREVDEAVASLFARQFDVEAHGFAAALRRALVGASMMPGPPPVMTANLCLARPLASHGRRDNTCRRVSSAPNQKWSRRGRPRTGS